ncbi:MAG: hypothetical protein WDN27_05180 [Candidatus Saccharibacteria bacterium]
MHDKKLKDQRRHQENQTRINNQAEIDARADAMIRRQQREGRR